MAVLFRRLCVEGRIHNRQQFRPLEGSDIWEFKRHAVRVFAFQHGRVWYVTHGCQKPKPRELKVHVQRAERIRAEHLARR